MVKSRRQAVYSKKTGQVMIISYEHNKKLERNKDNAETEILYS
jgi:hypothetical protein